METSFGIWSFWVHLNMTFIYHMFKKGVKTEREKSNDECLVRESLWSKGWASGLGSVEIKTQKHCIHDSQKNITFDCKNKGCPWASNMWKLDMNFTFQTDIFNFFYNLWTFTNTSKLIFSDLQRFWWEINPRTSFIISNVI